MSNNKGGCPPMYKTPEEMQEVIDKYFEDCNGEYVVIDGCVVTDKNGYSHPNVPSAANCWSRGMKAM